MTRVLIVEDSVVARLLVKQILLDDPTMQIVGEVADGKAAVAAAGRLKPDVITMDVRMPLMDGIEATRQIMQESPCPIVIISANDPKDARYSMEAMGAGAVAVLGKPSGPTDPRFEQSAGEIRRTVKAMAGVKVIRRRRVSDSTAVTTARAGNARRVSAPYKGTVRAIGIASSTGGPDALKHVLGALPATLSVPVLLVQHIAAGFHAGLAEWLDANVPLKVKLAGDNERLRAGVVYLAGGDAHLTVRSGGITRFDHRGPVGSHKPSANVLFSSMAKTYGENAAGVVMTGMGADGADGLLEMRQAGALTFAQDQASSIVYGMPKEAMSRGAARQQLALHDIAPALVRAAARG